MFPEGDGGDRPEDPHYGLFGAAFLTAAEINKYGLKSYHFLVSDAPGRDLLDPKQLVRVYGDEVWDKVVENGHQVNKNRLPSTAEVVTELLKRTHAFFLQVGGDSQTQSFWKKIYGSERMIVLPDVEYLPHVQAAIVGLTEGTLDLQTVEEFLVSNNLKEDMARQIRKSVSNIPIGAQKALPGFEDIPLKGDMFQNKTDLWPIGHEKGEDRGKKDSKKIPAKKKAGIRWE